MRRAIHEKRVIKSRPAMCKELDCHKWASKMEIHRLLSGKPDLKIKAIPEPSD